MGSILYIFEKKWLKWVVGLVWREGREEVVIIMVRCLTKEGAVVIQMRKRKTTQHYKLTQTRRKRRKRTGKGKREGKKKRRSHHRQSMLFYSESLSFQRCNRITLTFPSLFPFLFLKNSQFTFIAHNNFNSSLPIQHSNSIINKSINKLRVESEKFEEDERDFAKHLAGLR